jgi:Ca2+-binding RTX toxin-like protein
VVLKLVDPDDDTNITTKVIVVDYEDIWLDTEVNPYGVDMTGSDGLVIIESNDYNFSGEDWLIYGAQLMVSSQGVTGTAIDLNRDTGDTGGSIDDGDSLGGDTVDADVIKVVDIGIITATTGTEDADLSFELSLSDADGDTTATQTLDVKIESNGVFIGDEFAESIHGSSNGDTINGGGGNDILTGNGGADTFVFDISVDEGTDTIIDFASAEDMLSFLDVVDGGGNDVADVNAMIDTISNVDGHVAVNFNNGTTVEFANVAFASQNSIDDLVNDASQILVTHV